MTRRAAVKDPSGGYRWIEDDGRPYIFMVGPRPRPTISFRPPKPNDGVVPCVRMDRRTLQFERAGITEECVVYTDDERVPFELLLFLSGAPKPQ